MLTHTRILLAVAARGEPPSEFRIFTAGKVRATKGTFLFDEKASAAVLAKASDWSNEFSLDYEHDAVNPRVNGPKPAAGWFNLELRAGELWAVNVRWTPNAAEFLRNGEYRYISPAFNSDDDTGRITDLVNCALTNLPSTKGLTPLVELRALPFHAFAVDPSPWNQDEAIGRIQKWASHDRSGAPDTIDWHKYALGFAWHDARAPKDPSSYKLCHHDVVDGTLVTNRAGVHAAAAAMRGVLSEVDAPKSDRIAVRKHLEQHFSQMAEPSPFRKVLSKMTAAQKLAAKRAAARALAAQQLADAEAAVILAKKKMADDGDDDEDDDLTKCDDDDADDALDDSDADDSLGKAPPAFIKKKIDAKAKASKKASKLTALALELAGTDDEEEAVGALHRFAKADENVKMLTKQVADITAERENDKKEVMIAEASRAGKLPPALHKWAREEMSLKALASYLKGAPVAAIKKETKVADAAEVVLGQVTSREAKIIKTILSDIVDKDGKPAGEKLFAENKVSLLTRNAFVSKDDEDEE